MLQTGSIFQGYQIKRQIGQGTFSEIYEARLVETIGKPGSSSPTASLSGSPVPSELGGLAAVAIKVDKSPVPVLIHEVAILNKLKGLSVPCVLLDQSSERSIVLSLFGDSLSSIRKRDGQIPPRVVGKLFLEILEIIKCMHAKGVVHRDIKPSNICLKRGVTVERSESDGETVLHHRFLIREGYVDPLATDQGAFNVALIDFGTAFDPNITTSRNFRGTSAYLSPRIEGGKADELREMDDLWALSFSAADLLIGGLPWKKGMTDEDTVDKETFLKNVVEGRHAHVPAGLFSALLNDEGYRATRESLRCVFGRLARGHVELNTGNLSDFPTAWLHASKLRLSAGLVLAHAVEDARSMLAEIGSKLDDQSNEPHIIRVLKESASLFSAGLASLPANAATFGCSSSGQVCVSQLVTGKCDYHSCPLLHSHAVRGFRQPRPVCIPYLLTGICEAMCSKAHMIERDLNHWLKSGTIKSSGTTPFGSCLALKSS